MYEPLKDETKQQYLKIWSHYAIGHLNQEQLAKLFACSQDTVANAIAWCAKNRIQFNAYILAEAAKEALENRLRELKNDLIRAKETNPPSWNAVIGLNRIIKENEELLWQFQAIVQDKSSVTVNTQISQYQKFDYEIMHEIEENRQEQKRLRELVDTWTDEEKRRFLLLMKGMEKDKKITVFEQEGKTILKIEDSPEGKAEKQAPNPPAK